MGGGSAHIYRQLGYNQICNLFIKFVVGGGGEITAATFLVLSQIRIYVSRYSLPLASFRKKS